MDPDTVAKAFVELYYTTFDANRAGALEPLPRLLQGAQNIVAKLTSLPFQQCQHAITTVNCQSTGPTGGKLVFVSSNLQLPGEQHALKFCQFIPLFFSSL